MTPQDSITFAAELEAIKAESIGWLPLDQGVYFHHGDMVIQVVGIPDAAMAGMNVLLVGW